MGRIFADELAGTDLPLETQILYHLRGNFYPAIPSSMVTPCVESIDAILEDDIYREIDMPEGITYKGETTAPAYAIAEAHKLGSWLS